MAVYKLFYIQHMTAESRPIIDKHEVEPWKTNLASKPDGDTLIKNINNKGLTIATPRAYTNCKGSISYKDINNITKQTLCTT